MIDYAKKYKVNILGTKYTLSFSNSEKDNYITSTCDGYCDKSDKTIVIWDGTGTNLNYVKEHINSIIRHEIIHAFLNESGLQDSWRHKEQGHDETTIDWFAHQMPKMNNALKDAGLVDCIL